MRAQNAGFFPPRRRRLTPAVSRRATADGLAVLTAIGAVGSSALFGPDAPPPPRLHVDADAVPAADATPRHDSHDLRPGRPAHGALLGHRRRVQAPAPSGLEQRFLTPFLPNYTASNCNYLTFPYRDFSEYACGLADDIP